MTTLPIELLKPHEQISIPHGLKLLWHVVKSGRTLPAPLLVDGATGVILDGHHRYWVCRILGITRVPCVCVNYFSDIVTVTPRRTDVPVSKSAVIVAAFSGKKMPRKSTCHSVCQR
jgi:L-serine kinase (ADP)